MSIYVNKFPGVCSKCQGKVAKGMGVTFKVGPKWVTMHKDNECVGEVVPLAQKYAHVRLDAYQNKIDAAILNGVVGKHVVVNAKAGTGKTTLQCYSYMRLKERNPDLKILCLAFGHDDGQRLRAGVPITVDAFTTHSFCMQLVRTTYRGAQLSKTKLNDLLEIVVPETDNENYVEERECVTELLEKVHADAILRNDHDGYKACIESYGLALPTEANVLNKIFGYVDEMLRLGDDIKTYGFTFNEALYFVATRDRIVVPHYDVVGMDECQDYNRCQILLTRKLMLAGARIVIFGDPNQSLYEFRGAQADSFAQLRQLLVEDSRGADDFLMPYCRRCSKAVIASVKSIVSDIMPMPSAVEGSANRQIPLSSILEVLEDGDLVACRTNAPLVRLAWTLLAAGRKFYMRGGDKESNKIKWLVKMLAGQGSATTDPGEIVARAGKWLEERAGKSPPYKMIDHQGRVEVITMVSERVTNVKELLKEIDLLFRQPADLSDCVILSTIHRAKGSEAKRVIHLKPDLVPHKLAVTPKQKAQEENAAYVVRTRAMVDYIETVGDWAAA